MIIKVSENEFQNDVKDSDMNFPTEVKSYSLVPYLFVKLE